MLKHSPEGKENRIKFQETKEIEKEKMMRLECRNLTKKYYSTIAVDGIDLNLQAGKIYALLGPNGSGKSTLMKMIAGLTKPNSGDLLYEGEPLNYAMKAEIAYMPTEPYFFPYMRCIDAAKYYEDFFEDFSMERFLQLMQEMELKSELKCRELSSGMAAKLKIALTMSRKSRIIMLDEPLNGIDLIARDHIISAIISNLDSDTTVVLSSHLVDELEKIVDEAIFMKNGKILLSGAAEELREQRGKSITDLYREIYGGNWEVV